MNRASPARAFEPVTLRPAWAQQAGESDEDYYARREASLIAWYAARGRGVPSLAIDCAVSVGCFDGNGNPKGSGWW